MATPTSIGAQLREAREQRQMTQSAVAQATRSKTAIIEAIERDDFSVFAATVYGKGFIRLYAQVVGLDPQPLVEAYAAQMRGAKAPSLVSDDAPAPVPLPAEANADPRAAAPPAADSAPTRPPPEEYDLFNAQEARAPRAAVSAPPRKTASRLAVVHELLREVCIRWWQALRESLRLGRTSAAAIPERKDPWTAVPVVIGVVVVLIFVISSLTRCAPRSHGTGSGSDAGAGGQLKLAMDVREPYFE